MTWNYYIYFVVDLTTEEVLADCGESYEMACDEYESLKEKYPDHKIAIQQQHNVARIIKK